MSKNVLFSTPRQLEFRFEGDDVWERLPRSACQECQSLLAQLLAAVIRHDIELFQEAKEDERQD